MGTRPRPRQAAAAAAGGDGAWEARVRPSKQPLMTRTFLKVYMELGSYFLFLQEQIKDIIIIVNSTLVVPIAYVACTQ